MNLDVVDYPHRRRKVMHMFRFDFALSYAGEEEGIASDLYRLLNQKGSKVFFFKTKKVYLFAKSLKKELPHVFGPHSRFFVPILSENYIRKYWPKYEFELARKEERKRGFEFILPIRLDHVSLEGLEEDVVYIDLRKEGILATAEMMIEKLRERYPREEVPPPVFWVVNLGIVEVDEIVWIYGLPSSVPTDYAHLCDWLEKDLMERVSKSPLEGITLLEDSRDGEGLSVRLGFRWNPELGPLDFGDVGWWNMLEIGEFHDFYPDQNPKEVIKG